MSNLTFQGCDPSAHTVCYRGGLGRLYTLSVDVDPALGVKHGTILQEVSTRAQFVVVGVSVEGGLANGDTSGKHHGSSVGELWVHQRGAKHPTCIKGLTDTTDLQKQFSIVGRSTDSGGSVFLGPLGTSYQFSTSSSALTTQWGVTAGEQYYLKHFEENVRVCGELFGVLWVTKESQPNIAVPLSLCTSEDVLHSVFGLCQYVHAPKSGGGAMTPRRTEDMLVPSPRRATNTPRHASQGGGAPLNLDIDRSKEIATCNGPFGSTVRCSFSQEALGPFGVSFNQKLVTRKGLDAGKFCRVVGISNRSLYVLYDGDTRVTCIRGVSNAKELEEAFGAGKGPSNDDAKRSPSPAKGGNSSNNNDEPLASPRRPKAQKRFWTAFGRLPFDTSDSCCAPFGFPHGKVIRINNGILAGKQYTVVGVRSGALWVVEDGSSRCIPLSHCQNKAELLKMYKIESPAGAPKRNLAELYQLESEPPATPMNSPRHRLSASPERVSHNNDRALQYSPAGGDSPSPARSDNNPATTVTSSSHHAAAAPAQSSPVPKSIPFLNLTNTDSYEAAAPTVAKVPSYQMASPAASVAAAKGNVNSSMMSTSEVGASSTAAPRIQDLAAGSARQYLKAFALLKMGVSLHSVASSPTASLAFHEYYMQDTMKRIREAFDRLPKVKALWEHENRTPANFFAADCAVLLKFLQERPSVTTYR